MEPTAHIKLFEFKKKIEEGLSLVLGMNVEGQLKAVQFWNLASEKLQDIVNRSAADVNVLLPNAENGTNNKDFCALILQDINDKLQENRKCALNTQKSMSCSSVTNKSIGVDSSLKAMQETVGKQNEEILTNSVSDKPSLPETNQPICPPVNKGSCKYGIEKEKLNENTEEWSENGLDGIVKLDVKSSKIFFCQACDKHFEVLDSYLEHQEWHEKQCGSESSTLKGYMEQKGAFLCLTCNSRFATKGNIMVHQRSHTGEKPFACEICDASFSTNGNLKRHRFTHTGEKPFICQLCGSSYTELKSLKIHLRKHTSEKPYQCQECGKRFAQKAILQTHASVHRDEKNYSCEHCEKSFKQSGQLTVHLLRHKGVKQFSCKMCDAQFVLKGDLHRHVRTHSGERPFVCDFCSKPFTRKQTLNEHLNKHYNIKPFECHLCDQKFFDKSSCLKHTKRHETNIKTPSLKPIGDSTTRNDHSQLDLASGVIVDERLKLLEKNNFGIMTRSVKHDKLIERKPNQNFRTKGKTKRKEDA